MDRGGEPGGRKARATGVSRPLARTAVGAVLLGIGVAGVLAGGALALLSAGALGLLVYLELRMVLGVHSSWVTLGAGGAAVVGFLLLGHAARFAELAWVLGGLILLLLTLRVLLIETGGAGVSGATDDIGATTTAAAVVGGLGAHLLLLRALPEMGFAATALFCVLLLGHGALSTLGAGVARGLGGGGTTGAPSVAAALGIAGAALVGLAAGLTGGAALRVGPAIALGALTGALGTVGDLTGDAIRRSAGIRRSGVYLRAADPVGLFDGPLFCAPVFYWAYRVLAL